MPYNTVASRLADYAITIVLLLFSLVCIIPFLYIVMGSFTTTEELIRRGLVLFPDQFTLDAYRYMFSTNTILRSLLVSIFVTVSGTLINLFFTTLMAYPLTRKDLDGRNVIMFLVLFSMLFSGGMIPTYLIVRELGLPESFWALTIPVAISAFTYYIEKLLPAAAGELGGMAKIDGCNDLGILFRIVLPLSLPAIATFALFYAVGHWNDYFPVHVVFERS